MRRHLARLAAVGIGTVVAIACGEVAACTIDRFSPPPEVAGDPGSAARWVVLREPARTSRGRYLVPSGSPHGVSATREVRFSITADGYVAGAPERRDALTVAFVGGSATECLSVDEAFRFPRVAAEILERRLGVPVDALNGGASGSHTMHATLLSVAKVLRRRPRAVVLMEAIDDLTTLLLGGSYWTPPAARELVRAETGLFAWPRTFDAVMPHRGLPAGETPHAPMFGLDVPGVRSAAPGESELASMRREFSGAVRGFVAAVRAFGSQPVLMTQVNRIRTDDPIGARFWPAEAGPRYKMTWAEYVKAYRSFNEVIRQVAAAEAVPLIDLDVAIPATSAMIEDHVHLTREGSTRVGAVVAEGLLPLIARAREGPP